MKHTPGPWVAHDHIFNPYVTALSPSGGGSRITVASCVHPADAFHSHQRMNNARLIAAAPQMLEALSELIAEADEHPGWEGHKYSNSLGFQMARAAIAKAEGRE